jgi:hypothetical protein
MSLTVFQRALTDEAPLARKKKAMKRQAFNRHICGCNAWVRIKQHGTDQ